MLQRSRDEILSNLKQNIKDVHKTKGLGRISNNFSHQS